MAFKTVAPGVLVREDLNRTYKGKPDRYFTIRYRVDGKRHQEALGWASEGWNLAKAQVELARLKAAAATGEGAVTLRERREAAQRKREAEQNAPTIESLWPRYRETLKNHRLIITYESSIRKHLQAIMPLRIEDLRTFHIDQLRRQLEEQGYKPQTVKHQIALVRQICRWGAKHGYCELPPLHLLYFDIPEVSNTATETLTPEEVARFLAGLDRYEDKAMALALKLALATGIRRHALFCLTWDDIDFRSRQIRLRAEHAKNGKTSFVPMNSMAEDILRAVVPTQSPLVFSEINFQSTRVQKVIAYAKKFLPAGFRAFHGLRHVFASTLASSGKVDMMTLQRLLTQASPEMVQRYSHLHNEALRRASNVMDDALREAVNDASGHDGGQAQDTFEPRARVKAFNAFKKR